MSNVHGRATAITVMTPVKRGWTPWMRVNFWLGRRFPAFNRPLRELSFIHFARWAFIERIPFNGPPQDLERLNHTYVFFESNFNGSWDQYIDAFARILTRNMWATWGSAYGFPGPLPVTPFKAYIRRNEFFANHYHSAYPEASTTMILSALELRQGLAGLAREARTASPEHFSASFREFVSRMQRHL